MMLARHGLLALALFAGVVRGAAADGASTMVVVDGQVLHALSLSAADLRTMPAIERAVSFQTDHGERHDTYVGALLWSVVMRAGVSDKTKWGELRHVAAVTGKDGYLLMVSLGEIDPNFGNAPMLIAYERNGRAIEGGGLRLVVPGDRHGARNVQDVVHIEIR